MKMAAKIGVGGVVAAAAGVWFYFTPHLAVQNMKEAADERDANKLSRYIDFPAVRESMKATLNAKLMSEMAKNKKSDSPFAGLGAAFAMAMVGPMVDAMVTPEALTMMMSRGSRSWIVNSLCWAAMPHSGRPKSSGRSRFPGVAMRTKSIFAPKSK
jgi:hypothetical protein